MTLVRAADSEADHEANLLNTHVIALALARSGGVCDNLMLTARKLLILNGEMSEWLKEHAWKTKPSSGTEPLRGMSRHTRSAS